MDIMNIVALILSLPIWLSILYFISKRKKFEPINPFSFKCRACNRIYEEFEMEFEDDYRTIRWTEEVYTAYSNTPKCKICEKYNEDFHHRLMKRFLNA
jgi:hypothetical protein